MWIRSIASCFPCFRLCLCASFRGVGLYSFSTHSVVVYRDREPILGMCCEHVSSAMARSLPHSPDLHLLCIDHSALVVRIIHGVFFLSPFFLVNMTILEAVPLNKPRDYRNERLMGKILILVTLLALSTFLVSLWGGSYVFPLFHGMIEEPDWYYLCLIPATLPTAAFFSYWIWLSSQYFRYA